MVKRALLLFVCLLVSAGVVARADRAEPVPIRQTLEQFPMAIGEWRGVREPPFAKDILAVLGVNDYLTRAYFTPDRAGVGLYIGYYQSQRQGDTMHSPLSCLPGAGWEPLSKAALRVNVDSSPGGPPRDIEINRYLIRKGLDKQLVLYWYEAHNRVVASEVPGQVLPDCGRRSDEPHRWLTGSRHCSNRERRKWRKHGGSNGRSLREVDVPAAVRLLACLSLYYATTRVVYRRSRSYAVWHCLQERRRGITRAQGKRLLRPGLVR